MRHSWKYLALGMIVVCVVTLVDVATAGIALSKPANEAHSPMHISACLKRDTKGFTSPVTILVTATNTSKENLAYFDRREPTGVGRLWLRMLVQRDHQVLRLDPIPEDYPGMQARELPAGATSTTEIALTQWFNAQISKPGHYSLVGFALFMREAPDSELLVAPIPFLQWQVGASGEIGDSNGDLGLSGARRTETAFRAIASGGTHADSGESSLLLSLDNRGDQPVEIRYRDLPWLPGSPVQLMVLRGFREIATRERPIPELDTAREPFVTLPGKQMISQRTNLETFVRQLAETPSRGTYHVVGLYAPFVRRQGDQTWRSQVLYLPHFKVVIE